LSTFLFVFMWLVIARHENDGDKLNKVFGVEPDDLFFKYNKTSCCGEKQQVQSEASPTGENSDPATWNWKDVAYLVLFVFAPVPIARVMNFDHTGEQVTYGSSIGAVFGVITFGVELATVSMTEGLEHDHPECCVLWGYKRDFAFLFGICCLSLLIIFVLCFFGLGQWSGNTKENQELDQKTENKKKTENSYWIGIKGWIGMS